MDETVMMLSPEPLSVDSGHAACSADDVNNSYRLFLGREPESEAVVSGNMQQSVYSLVVSILSSEEFYKNIISYIATKRTMPCSWSPSTGLNVLVNWAIEIFQFERKESCVDIKTYESLLERIFSSPSFKSHIRATLTLQDEDLKNSNILKTLERYVIERQSFLLLNPHPERRIAGCIDFVRGDIISGWAANHDDLTEEVEVEIYCNGQFIGRATANEFRRDLQEALGGTGKHAFLYKLNARHCVTPGSRYVYQLKDGVSRVAVGNSVSAVFDLDKHLGELHSIKELLTDIRKRLDGIDRRLPGASDISLYSIANYHHYWKSFYRVFEPQREKMRAAISNFAFLPKFTIIVPTFNSDLRLLSGALQSLAAQVYHDWDLIITDDASENIEAIEATIYQTFPQSPRVKLVKNAERKNISGNTNSALPEIAGDYVIILDHDDQIAEDALFCVASAIQEKKYGIIYSDEDRTSFDEFGELRHHTPFFKPDFDYHLLLNQNYICHLMATRADVFVQLQGFREDFNGCQDHDLVLRMAKLLPAEDIRHIPRILYHWHVNTASMSQNDGNKALIDQRIRRCVDEHLDGRAVAAPQLDSAGNAVPFTVRVKWPLPPKETLLSIIIPTRDRLDLLGPCIAGIVSTMLANKVKCEILIVNNSSQQQITRSTFRALQGSSAIRVIDYDGEFNWAAINNYAAQRARGDLLMFLNNDTIPITQGWIDEICQLAALDDVGAVGCQLLYEDGTIQHAGVVLGHGGVAGHESLGISPSEGGYFNRVNLTHETSAVTGACMTTRRDVFEKLGGFDSANLPIAFNDIEFCLKVRAAGYKILYTPHAVLYHYESKSRGFDSMDEKKRLRAKKEEEFILGKWGDEIAKDRYFNPHFDRFASPFSQLTPPPGREGA